VPEPPFWGVREIPVDPDEVYSHLDTHVLFKLHWGGKGVKGEAWRELVEGDFRPRLERMWREQTYLHPRALLGYFPCYSEGNDIVVLDPEDRDTVLERFTCPRQPKGARLCLADYFRPKDSGELDVVALQAVTVGDEVAQAQRYMTIQGQRFGERTRFVIEADPAALDAPLPCMTLQPLVENALIHGIGKREQGGTVSLTVQRGADRIAVAVSDDGDGISPDRVAALNAAEETAAESTGGHTTGLGIQNVRRRLELYYQNDASLTVTSRPGCGTTVTLDFPAHPEGEDEHAHSRS
jgi:anti-sigma regulatory factor (Ser/Thr protein kinase)